MAEPDNTQRQQGKWSVGHPWRWLFGALALLLFSVLGVLAYLAINADRLAAELVDGIPAEQEAILGDLALVEIASDMKLHDAGPAVDALRAIGERLTAGSPFRYRWYVGARPQLNAISAPGGVIVVYAGMVEAAASAEELAGVLAHEVAHIELRHRMRAQIKDMGLTGLLRLLLGDASAGARLGQLGALKFSRDAETEADLEGVRRLHAAGIDPHGMVTMYQKLLRPENAAGPTLSATHPATEDRIVRLRQEIARVRTSPPGGLGRSGGAKDSPYAPLAIDWPQVQASLRRP